MSADWRDRAACKDQPGMWDFDAVPADQAQAQWICWNACPVQDQCAEYARTERPDGGIWGGELLLHKLATAETCKRGHDVTGPNARDRNGSCRECKNAKRREKRADAFVAAVAKAAGISLDDTETAA